MALAQRVVVSASMEEDPDALNNWGAGNVQKLTDDLPDLIDKDEMKVVLEGIRKHLTDRILTLRGEVPPGQIPETDPAPPSEPEAPLSDQYYKLLKALNRIATSSMKVDVWRFQNQRSIKLLPEPERALIYEEAADLYSSLKSA